MKRTITLCCLLISFFSYSQVAVNMASQNRYTFVEDFADVANWTFSTTTPGVFTAGTGAEHWKGVAAGGTGTIPNGTKITAATTSFASSEASGGLHKLTESIGLLSTGTSDNTTSAAFDLYLNYTGLQAGILNFDWASVNNSTGNRKSSLHVYASVDNITFVEIAAAQVTNFTNNAPVTGSIKNVQLPASFNNRPSCIIRFYYNNGSGGTTGSRPKLSIDNVKVTAVPATVCAEPSSQPTSLVFSNVTPVSLQGSFSAAVPAADSYLVLISNNPSLTALPVDGVSYDIGDNIGDADVVSIDGVNFSASNLSASTQYYFYVIAYNAICSNGPRYKTISPLTGTVATTSGSQPCAAPTSSPSNVVFSAPGATNISGSFTAATADGFLVLRSTSATLSPLPVNGTAYTAGDAVGNATVISSSAATAFTSGGLSSSTTYYFYVFAYNDQLCNNGPAYNSTAPLTGSATTQALQVCNTPASQPFNLNLSATNTSINGVFSAAATADNYLVIYSTSPSLATQPADGTTYAPGAAFGNGIVAGNIAATAFYISSLQAGTTYYVYVFAQNSGCTNGPKYNRITPLSGQTTTTTVAALNYYFGNLHAHSRYSDGNKDNSTYTPAEDYAFARNSMCMDFLGISEHNHSGAGMNRSNWQPGITKALAATSANFLALFGMEWGVISGGGHVLVYGVNQLLGWETNNYDQYVAKNNYTGTPETNGTTGLFRYINAAGNNAFAMLAHPNTSDYNNLLQGSYNAMADSAIVGVAVESGPAFSTSTTYNDPASSMSFLSYYKKLLAKGYHVGPSIDHDNHNTTFGRTSYARLAVLAPSLTSNSIFTAMRNNNFYATEDCDTHVSFTLNNAIMGSELQGTTAPAININATDVTSPGAVPVIRIMKGIPGSGTDATEVANGTGASFNFTDNSLQASTTAYYYADITIAGARTITAPIWYTRNANVLAIELLSFNAVKNNNHSVNITWSASQENTTANYIVERSFNGTDFRPIYTQQVTSGNYQVIDKSPVDGLNFYRLQIIEKDGKQSFSKVVAVNFNDADVHSFVVYPNPVLNQVQLSVHSATSEQATIVVEDLLGKKLFSRNVQLQKGNQLLKVDAQQLPAGTYVISLQLTDKKLFQKIVKM